jgi:hypothetical protein
MKSRFQAKTLNQSFKSESILETQSILLDNTQYLNQSNNLIMTFASIENETKRTRLEVLPNRLVVLDELSYWSS